MSICVVTVRRLMTLSANNCSCRVVGPHRIHEVQTIAASVSFFVTRTGCAKKAERIDVLFGVETPGDQ